MRTRNNIRFVLIVGLTIVILLGSADKTAAFHPQEQIYEVLVKSSFGAEFPDCYRYKADGTLIIDQLGIPGVYDHDRHGTKKTKTQGINADGFFGLATHALHRNRFTRIEGNAISSEGLTFTFKGSRKADCAVVLQRDAAAHPYKKP